jgi:hypothetical protein
MGETLLLLSCGVAFLTGLGLAAVSPLPPEGPLRRRRAAHITEGFNPFGHALTRARKVARARVTSGEREYELSAAGCCSR